MSRNALYRVAGNAGLGSALLALVALVAFIVVVGSDKISEAAGSSGFYVPTVAALGSTLLLALALIGLYLFQESRVGSAGLAAFVVALLGTILAAGSQWTYIFVLPYFADDVPELIDETSGVILVGFLLSYAVLAIGWVWFAIVTLKAKVLPRGGGIAMLVGAAIAFLPMPSRTLILTMAVAYLGNFLRRGASLPAKTPPT